MSLELSFHCRDRVNAFCLLAPRSMWDYIAEVEKVQNVGVKNDLSS